jgi:hypothetical protein
LGRIPVPNTTFAALIHAADQRLARAKWTAELARLDSRAAPADVDLRAKLLAADADASTAGRRLSALRFEESLDLWVDRAAANDVEIDETLLALAPRFGGEPDWYWVAAAHLARSGVTVPRNWRSPSGEPVVSTTPNPESRSSPT